MVAIAVAVVALTQRYEVFAFLGPIGSGAASAAAASAVSQGVGVAAGIQDKFSFKGVAMAAVSAGIGGGGMVAILWKLYKAASQQTVPKLTVSAELLSRIGAQTSEVSAERCANTPRRPETPRRR